MTQDSTTAISETREIPLTQGFVALVDTESYDFVAQYKWHAQRCYSSVYASRNLRAGEIVSKGGLLLMHRMILSRYMEVPPRVQVDHINGVGVDNRRSNLRLATPRQNQANRGRSQTADTGRPKSQYKGVYFYQGKWQAFVRGKYLGRFETEVEAAQVYDAAARIEFGEFARLNFPA